MHSSADGVPVVAHMWQAHVHYRVVYSVCMCVCVHVCVGVGGGGGIV